MKKGFTLAELMIVLLILSILLAAMAPIVTKRRTSTPENYYENMSIKLEQQIKGLAEENQVLEERITELELQINEIKEVIELTHGFNSLNRQ